MTLYSFNSNLHKYKKQHDETGGSLKDMLFQYSDCFCGSSEYEIVSTTTRHHNQFTIVRCKYCSTLRINPYMTEDSIIYYYKEVYGRVKRNNRSASDLYEMQKTDKNAKALFTKLSPYASSEDKILDYGSGAGGRLDEFLQQNYKQLHLFDHDKKYVDYGLSKGYHKHDQEKKYQLIILSHVIEHINEPIKLLSELAAMLATEGHIYIEVPLYENTKTLLSDFHLAHKYYFSKISLTLLANLAGLKVVSDYKNAILVTLGEANCADFSSKDAETIWLKQLFVAKRKELFKKPSRYIQQLLDN